MSQHERQEQSADQPTHQECRRKDHDPSSAACQLAATWTSSEAAFGRAQNPPTCQNVLRLPTPD
jgi:hypothetical protein